MPGAVSTKIIRDGAGVNFTQSVWDPSGTGDGPFLPINYGDEPITLSTPFSRDATIGTSQEFLAANADRKSVVVHNKSDQNAYVLESANAATAVPGGYTFIIPAFAINWEMPRTRWLGAMTFIMEAAASAGGALNVVERS